MNHNDTALTLHLATELNFLQSGIRSWNWPSRAWPGRLWVAVIETSPELVVLDTIAWLWFPQVLSFSMIVKYFERPRELNSWNSVFISDKLSTFSFDKTGHALRRLHWWNCKTWTHVFLDGSNAIRAYQSKQKPTPNYKLTDCFATVARTSSVCRNWAATVIFSTRDTK